MHKKLTTQTAFSRLTGFLAAISTLVSFLAFPAKLYADNSITQLPEKALVWQADDELFSPSSPRLVDLNGNGTLDIVQGNIRRDGDSIVQAIDGKTGETMWVNGGFTDLFTSANFADFNGDGTADIVIGGRRVQLATISGKTGETIWQFERQAEHETWGNFYTSQIIGDINGDGIPDILTTNGGDERRDKDRYPGLLLIISGKTGKILKKLPSPDGQETYMSPVVINNQSDNPTILFGSGGETLPGALWQISLSDLLKENPDGFRRLINDENKGFIAPPSIADFTGNGVPDIVIQSFDGTISLIDGKTHNILWQLEMPEYESIKTPTLGYFTGDDTPDIFVQLNKGVFPKYETTRHMLLDGTDGSVLWQEDIGRMSASGAVAIDLNSNGHDDIIFIANVDNPYTGIRQAHYYVLNTKKLEKTLWHKTERYIVANPWAGDMDQNGKIDVLIKNRDKNEQTVLSRYQLPVTAPDQTSWGSYMGSRFTGHLTPRPAQQSKQQ